MYFFLSTRKPGPGFVGTALGLLTAFPLLFCPAPAHAESQAKGEPEQPSATYADLADLADSAKIVVRAQVRKVIRLEPERAIGARPGFGRFYVEARTRGLLWGIAPMGEKLRYLADFRLDAKGRPPKLVKTEVLLFALSAAGRQGDLRLAAPDAQVPASVEAEAHVRAILTELAAPDSPPKVTGLREAIHVPGTLSGSGETQMFLSTSNGTAAAIIVNREPGRQPAWALSFSELASSGTPPPARNTLAWYRLACFLPADLPPSADISERPQDRAQARADYRFMRRELGDCPRLRR